MRMAPVDATVSWIPSSQRASAACVVASHSKSGVVPYPISWATIAPNYEYGQSAVAEFKKLLQERKPEVEFIEDLAKKAVHALQFFGVETAIAGFCRAVVDEVERPQRPVLEEERLVALGQLVELLDRLPLVAQVHLDVVLLGPLLARLEVDLLRGSAADGLDAGDEALRLEVAVHRELVGLGLVGEADQPKAAVTPTTIHT